MQIIHGYVSSKYEIDNPHELLHQYAVSEFNVKSMAELSMVQLNDFYKKIRSIDIDWDSFMHMGVMREPQMSDRQRMLVEKLQKELGWSDRYMFELTAKRYGYIDWRCLSGKAAWNFIHYLISRKKSKKRKDKNGQVSSELPGQ